MLRSRPAEAEAGLAFAGLGDLFEPVLDSVLPSLVETFLARGEGPEKAARERRARSVAEGLTREGTGVRFERTIHVPEDEICFFVFDAPSGQDAALAAELAELAPMRIVEAVSTEETIRTSGLDR